MKDIYIWLFCIILCLIVYYDFRFRAVPLFALLAALFIGLLISATTNGWHQALYFSGVNLFLLSMQLCLTWLYFSIRKRQLTNILDTFLGSGDIMFFLVLVVCFSPVNFIVFIIFSSFITLLFYGFRKRGTLIPLAGFQSLILSALVILNIISGEIQFYNDYVLYKIFVTK